MGLTSSLVQVSSLNVHTLEEGELGSVGDIPQNQVVMTSLPSAVVDTVIVPIERREGIVNLPLVPPAGVYR